jgi:hypothetical protein
MVMLSSISLMMMNSKNLLAHPNKLTLYTCLAEACACWHCMIELLGSTSFICYLRMDDFWSYTTWNGDTKTPQEAIQSVQTLRRSNVMMF